MARALYDPKHGFYTKGPVIGRPSGAFNTNAMFPAFAFALMLAIQQATKSVGKPLRIVELGGGTGELASNILSLFSATPDYIIIEASPSLREQQKNRGLATVESPEALSPAPTFVFGNEVLDALPVHRVFNDGSALSELYVGLDENGEFIELPNTPSTPQLARRLNEHNIELGRGQVAEICLDLCDFLQNIKKIISTGYVMFIDYGDDAKNLYSYTKRNGTLRSFRSQQLVDDPFDFVGEQDLTADVDFSALTQIAQQEGLLPVRRLRQGTWLKNLGIEAYLNHADDRTAAQIEIEQLTNMARLGSCFDVLLFKTPGLPDGPNLHS